MLKPNLKIVGAVVVTIGAIIFAVAVTSLTTGLASQPLVKGAQPTEAVEIGHSGTMLRPIYDLNNAGRNATLSEVTASVKLSEPTYLPLGTSLSQVKLHTSGDLAVLIYTNPQLTRLGGYRQDVQLLIIARRDGTSLENFEKFLATQNQPQKITVIDKDGKQYTENVASQWIVTNRSRPVSVGGVPGYGYSSIETPVHDSGEVQWWSKEGVHYEVIANLPLQELTKIAASIQHV